MEKYRIRLYVEKLDRIEKFLLLDFISDKDFLYFKNRSDVTDDMVMKKTEPSMILIRLSDFSCVHFSEGNVISIDAYEMINLKMNERNQMTTNVIGFEILEDETLINILNMAVVEKIPKHTLNAGHNKTCFPCSLENLDEKMQIKIFDVGQGSWNRITSNNYDTVFDCGASIFYSKDECRNIISGGYGLPRTKVDTSLIISHWDVDHYSLICSLLDIEIASFCCIFMPDNPVSITAKNTAQRILENARYANVITSAHESRKTKIVFESDRYILWKGTKCKNINKSGLSLAVYGNKTMFLFPADHSYKYLWDTMYSKVNKNKKNLMVHINVPHHGGLAGKMKPMKDVISGKAIVSTGKNNYRHPREEVRRYLCDDMNFEWIRTDWERNDIIIDIE